MRSWKTLAVSSPATGVVHVELNRPKKLNAMNGTFWTEIRECFIQLASDPDCRAIVLSARGRIFTAGLDIKDGSQSILSKGAKDIGRKALAIRKSIFRAQEAFSIIEKCPQPVIAAVHSGCVGGGVDLIAACDIRYCSEDSWYTIKEVDVGLAADVGTLQRLPKIVGNDSLVRELAFTARRFDSQEALRFGLVSRVLADKQELLNAAIATATLIATKSPIAIYGTKVNLNYSRDHSVKDGLDYMATWNMSMLQSKDFYTAIVAGMQKKKPTFAKL